MKGATCHPNRPYYEDDKCIHCFVKAWKDKNQPSFWKTPEGRRDNHLRSKYGITLAEYLALLELQKGVCAICELEETVTRNGEVKSLAVDHCHRTGRIRGLLCNRCNVAVGHLKDSPERARKLAEYLDD